MKNLNLFGIRFILKSFWLLLYLFSPWSMCYLLLILLLLLLNLFLPPFLLLIITSILAPTVLICAYIFSYPILSRKWDLIELRFGTPDLINKVADRKDMAYKAERIGNYADDVFKISVTGGIFKEKGHVDIVISTGESLLSADVRKNIEADDDRTYIWMATKYIPGKWEEHFEKMYNQKRIHSFSLVHFLKKNERAVVYLLGSFTRIAGPGFVLKIPLLQSLYVVNLDSAIPEWRGLPEDVIRMKVKDKFMQGLI